MVIKTLKAFTLRDAETGKLTSLAHGVVATVDSTTGSQLIADNFAVEYTPLVPEGTKSITSNGTYDVTQYASANVEVVPNLSVVVAPVTDDTVNLLGKKASDLQEDVAIANGAVTGTLKYVTGYTGFSGDVAEQSGNYLALKVVANADTITVELNGGTVGHPVTLEEDGMIVLRIADTSTQSITVVATKDNVAETHNLSISGLTLTPEG